MELQDELKKQFNMDFKNFKNDLASIHNDTVSLNEKIQTKISNPDQEDEHNEKLLEDKNKEYLKHTINEIVNNILISKAKDGSLLNTTGGSYQGDTTILGGKDGKDGKEGKEGGNVNYMNDIKNINKKIRVLEEQLKTLTEKVDNQTIEEDDKEKVEKQAVTADQQATDGANSGANAEELKKVLKRLKTCEGSIADLKNLKPEIAILIENDNEKEDKLNRLSDMCVNSSEKLKVMEKQIDKINTQLEDLNIKILDFDMYDMTKQTGQEGMFHLLKY